MDSDRSLRRLTALEETASTARVLNLIAAHKKGPKEDLESAPFFKNRLLDRSLILRHRIRPNEYDLFDKPRSSATKVLLPIDSLDLRAGARTFLLGQKDFEQIAEAAFGDDLKPGARDRIILDLLDDLPSLDPFLLRENLKRHGFEPAQSYFAISDADVQRMFAFVRQEIAALAKLSGASDERSNVNASRMVDKLLSSTPDAAFGPLRETLRLDEKEYQDGIFCWRGFLYYKWVLTDLTAPMVEVVEDIRQIQPRGPRSAEASDYLPEARTRLRTAIEKAAGDVQKTLAIYDTSYALLTQDGKPMAFRDFLLSAPGMFSNLGEQLGAIQHIVSFWRYRFPPGRTRLISPDDLMDIFLDFEDSLISRGGGAAQSSAA